MSVLVSRGLCETDFEMVVVKLLCADCEAARDAVMPSEFVTVRVAPSEGVVPPVGVGVALLLWLGMALAVKQGEEAGVRLSRGEGEEVLATLVVGELRSVMDWAGDTEGDPLPDRDAPRESVNVGDPVGEAAGLRERREEGESRPLRVAATVPEAEDVALAAALSVKVADPEPLGVRVARGELLAEAEAVGVAEPRAVREPAPPPVTLRGALGVALGGEEAVGATPEGVPDAEAEEDALSAALLLALAQPDADADCDAEGVAVPESTKAGLGEDVPVSTPVPEALPDKDTVGVAESVAVLLLLAAADWVPLRVTLREPVRDRGGEPDSVTEGDTEREGAATVGEGVPLRPPLPLGRATVRVWLPVEEMEAVTEALAVVEGERVDGAVRVRVGVPELLVVAEPELEASPDTDGEAEADRDGALDIEPEGVELKHPVEEEEEEGDAEADCEGEALALRLARPLGVGAGENVPLTVPPPRTVDVPHRVGWAEGEDAPLPVAPARLAVGVKLADPEAVCCEEALAHTVEVRELLKVAEPVKAGVAEAEGQAVTVAVGEGELDTETLELGVKKPLKVGAEVEEGLPEAQGEALKVALGLEVKESAPDAVGCPLKEGEDVPVPLPLGHEVAETEPVLVALAASCVAEVQPVEVAINEGELVAEEAKDALTVSVTVEVKELIAVPLDEAENVAVTLGVALPVALTHTVPLPRQREALTVDEAQGSDE